MLRRLSMTNFKSFRGAELAFGPLTILVGANATGKSNVREALRFVHGVSRGYTLSEILGEKWGDQGVLEWRGIRGGAREAAYREGPSFTLGIELGEAQKHLLTYQITTGVPQEAQGPRLLSEELWPGIDSLAFQMQNPLPRSRALFKTLDGGQKDEIEVEIEENINTTVSYRRPANRPLIRSLSEDDTPERHVLIEDQLAFVLNELSPMRFLDLVPDDMRRAASVGQLVLTDRGENLSSVLHSICASRSNKAALIRWLRLLTPMDVVDLSFPMDPAGRVLLSMVEQDGTEVSAYSASDGTLRFLAILAALLSPRPPRFLFLEELENGLHPSRLRLLLDLLRERTRSGDVQVVATTHSPALLALLDDETLAHTSLFFRREGEQEAHIQRLLDLPDAARILKEHDRGRLLASGWFENIVEFAAAQSEPLELAGEPA